MVIGDDRLNRFSYLGKSYVKFSIFVDVNVLLIPGRKNGGHF